MNYGEALFTFAMNNCDYKLLEGKEIYMPSEKPNFEEISILLKKRNQYYNQRKNLYIKLYFECASAIEGGFTTQDRAKKLLHFIESDNIAMTIFPNNLLNEVLLTYCGNTKWDDLAEEILLDIISDLYMVDINRMVGVELNVEGTRPLYLSDQPDLIRPPTIDHYMIENLIQKFQFNNELNYYLYNPLVTDVSIKDRFLGFTGAFNDFTRKTCFEKVRILGGVPSDPADYLDYFFVANKLVKDSAISRKMSTAILYQRLYGNPLIFNEDDWNRIIEIHTKK